MFDKQSCVPNVVMSKDWLFVTLWFNGTIGEIRLLVFNQSSVCKHHMLNEMFMIDKWMFRVDLYFSLSALRFSWC